MMMTTTRRARARTSFAKTLRVVIVFVIAAAVGPAHGLGFSGDGKEAARSEDSLAAASAKLELRTATADATATTPETDGPVKTSKMSTRRRKKSAKASAKKKIEKEEEEFKAPEPTLGEGESAIGSIHEAIDDDDMEELDDLLRWKPNLREKCQKLGETRHMVPIMKAAFLGNAKAIDLLLDYGANANEIDGLGYSALMRSVMAKCKDCVKILLDAGAVVNYVQKTPLMDLGLTAAKLAMIMREDEIASLLDAAGADKKESGQEKKRRLRQETADRFAEHVKTEGIDVDVDKLLKTTIDDLNVRYGDDPDVTVNFNGTNVTMSLNETKDYTNLAGKVSKQKADDAAKASCDSETAAEGECAFDAGAAAARDEL